MNDEHRQNLEGAIKDAFLLCEKTREFIINARLQFLIAQLDNFKMISSLVIGIAGISYFFGNFQLDIYFLVISFISALFVLIFSTSYAREIIDAQDAQHNIIYNDINEKMEMAIKKAEEALIKGNENIFYDHAKNQIREHPKPVLNYAGEAIVFFFYISVGFLILSHLSHKYNFNLISFQTALCILIAYCLSFKSWAIWVSKNFSRALKVH